MLTEKEPGSMNGAWKRSSKCVNGTCLEVRYDLTSGSMPSISVRDGKDPGPMLTVAPDAWAHFVEAVKADEFRSA